MAIGLLALAGAGLLGGGLAMSKIGSEAEKQKWKDPDQRIAVSGRRPSQRNMLQEQLRRHNAGELELPDQQIKDLSVMAAQQGMQFNPEAQPIKKFLFDAADSALFGLLPNEFRPSSIGEDLHGESYWDRQAGTLGKVTGGIAGGGLVLKGGKMALGGIKGWMGKGTAAQNAARANEGAQFYMSGVNPGLLGMPNVATGFQKYNPFRTQTQYTQGLYPAGGTVVTRGPNNSFTMF